MAMSMPKITACSMTDCAYNGDNSCHAIAITVGGTHPMCDTFMKTKQKGGVPDIIGGAGACKEDDCRFNKSLECTASGIKVGPHSGHGDCLTFSTG